MAIKFAAKDPAKPEAGKPARDIKPVAAAVDHDSDTAEGASDLFESGAKKPSRGSKSK